MSQTAPHEEERLLDFAYGELSEKERREVQSHLSACGDCRASLQDIQGVRKVMSAAPQVAAPEAGLESLLAYAEQAARRAQAGPAPKATWWRRWVLPLAGVSAAVVVGVVAHEVHEDGGNAARVAEQVAMQMPAPEFKPVPGAQFAQAIQAEHAAPEPHEALDRPRPEGTGSPVLAAAPRPAAPREVQLNGAGELRARKDDDAAAPMARREAMDVAGNTAERREKKAVSKSEEDRIASGPARMQPGRGAAAPAPPPSPAQQARDQYLHDAYAEAPRDMDSESEDKVPLRKGKEDARAASTPAASAPAATEGTASRAKALSDAAVQAYQEQDRELEARLLRQAVPLAGADRPLLSGILVRLCGAEYALGRTAAGDAACERVIQEFKGTAAARIAERQRKEHHAALTPPATRSLAPAKPTGASGDSPP
jgi:hypothetical protein